MAEVGKEKLKVKNMEITLKIFTGSGKLIGSTIEVDIDDALDTVKSHIDNGNIVLIGSTDGTKIDGLDLY